MYLTMVVDNMCGNHKLWGEHGLSIYIETARGNLLLDTGQGHSLLHNLSELKIDINKIGNLVLSHGHYDHCWGASQLLLRKPDITIWGSKDIDRPHYRNRGGKLSNIGHNLNLSLYNFNPIEEKKEIIPGIWAFSVPLDQRDPDFIPDTPGLVSLNEDETIITDPFLDDMSLVVQGAFGTSLILGCAHSGTVNIMKYASKLFNIDSFYAVIGGMHLSTNGEEKTEKIVRTLKDNFSVDKWHPCHCTGFPAVSIMSKIMTDVKWATSGTRIEL